MKSLLLPLALATTTTSAQAPTGDVQVLDIQTHGASLTAQLAIFGGTMTLDLQAHSLRSDDFTLLIVNENGPQIVPPPPPRTFRGTVVEIPGSSVAASYTEEGLTAFVEPRNGLPVVLIEPLSTYEPGAPPNAALVYSGDPSPPPPLPSETFLECELALDVDHEYSDGRREAVIVADVESIINAVDAVYRRDAGICYEITFIVVRTGLTPTYTNCSLSNGDLLADFRDNWERSHTSVSRDVAQLISGKGDCGGENPTGLASGMICGEDNAYSAAKLLLCSGLDTRIALSAHELGHNWSAQHCCRDNPITPADGEVCGIMVGDNPLIPDCLVPCTSSTVFGPVARASIASRKAIAVPCLDLCESL